MGWTALNTIVMLPGFPGISENPLIKRFIKDVFNTKPPKPRHTYIWYINKVLSCIANLRCNETLSDKILSQKLRAIQKVYPLKISIFWPLLHPFFLSLFISHVPPPTYVRFSELAQKRSATFMNFRMKNWGVKKRKKIIFL